MPAIKSVNDFVVKFANVNGSGSASANEMFARSILRMGVPVTSRNIFPSNIQGLPTWYEVRVSGKGSGRISMAGLLAYRPGHRGHFYYRLVTHRGRRGERRSLSGLPKITGT